jgi:hypothetical protein
LDLGHHRIHFGFAPDVVAERELRGASRAKGNFGFMGERCAGPNGQLQTMLKIEEGDSAMLELRADDALRRQTESIPIKLQRSFQIIDTESNHGDS